MQVVEQLRLEQDGVTYALERSGNGAAVMLLHGFTGSARTWDDLTPALDRDHQVIAVDLLGHGATDAPADARRYVMERATADLAGLLDQMSIERAAVIGYSMGGRLALGFAVAHPQRVSTLLLESAGAGIAEDAERNARRTADDRLAETIERDGVAHFVDAWERQPLFTSQSRMSDARRRAIRAERLRQSTAGLANSLRGFGQGAQPALHGRLGAAACPVLLVAGAEDAKFCDIAADLGGRLPNARVAIVPDAGHAVHLEQPDRFAEIVVSFVRSAMPAGEEAQ